MVQREVDMASELRVDGDFAIKTKKLLIMRGKELVEAIQGSYEQIKNTLNLIMIDVEVRMQIEKKLSIPETKDNIQIMSYCGWIVSLAPDESVTLKCPCC